MKEHRVSYRYARALIESSKEKGLADKIYEDFQKIKFTFEISRELRQLAASPVFQLLRKKKIIEEIFNEEKISKMTMDFLMLLIEKRRGNLILSIISEFEEQYNIMNNLLPIKVYSAIELNDEIKKEVVNKVTERTKMQVIPNYFTDPSLKGGILVRIGDWVFDASLKNQLKNLHKSLIGN
jgi:F-type H+-transporting ATPase subunit delta